MLKSIIGLLLLAITCTAAPYYSDYDKYLRFHWKGAVQSYSIQLKVFPWLDRLAGLNTFVVTYTKSNGAPVAPIFTNVPFVQDPYPVQQVTITGLQPTTKYFYTFIFTADSIINPTTFLAYYSSNFPPEFPFRTFALALTPYSFTFGAASCADTGSSSSVFQNLVDENFDFFMHMGDLHYEDISVNDANRFYQAYYKVFSCPSQKKFFQTVPVYYNWDDHDFGPNDANGNSQSKPATTMVFQRFATYSQLKNRLPADDSNIIGAPSATVETPGMYLSYNSDPNHYGIFRSFIVGRCLFMILDLRSFQDVVPGDILGDEQRNWIENQLRFAGNNDNIKMVFMISSVPWIDQDSGAVWGDFGANQEWMGKLVRQYRYDNKKEAMMIAGDAHMVAFDDGRNNDKGGFPVVQAASLDRPASCKGGPYSHGVNPERGQYARIEVTDSIDSKPCVNLVLKRYGLGIIAYNTCYPQFYPPSSENHCPSKFMIWLKTYPGAIYIMAFGSLLVFALICFSIFMCRRKRRMKKLAMQKEKEKREKEQKELNEQKADEKREEQYAKGMDFAPPGNYVKDQPAQS